MGISSRQKLLIISFDIISKNMAGPAIRYWELAQALKDEVDVTLAVPVQSVSSSSEIPFVHYSPETPKNLKTAAQQADILLVAGYILYKFPFLAKLDMPIIVDLYGPFILENLEIHTAKELTQQMVIHKFDVSVLNSLLQRGDFFLCASEKQRDFWLGLLAANNRLNPYNYQEDKAFHKLIATVPFGIPSTQPIHTKVVLKGVYKTIKADDQVILWGGGIWDWFDPLTLIRALAEVIKVRPKVKLFFLGTQHPHDVDVPKMRAVQATYELAQTLGLLDTHIFFNDWVAYDDRQNYLLEADVGVSLHFQIIENRFSFRTRILDYIWAGLPILANGGDTIAELIEKEGLGQIVPVGNVAATKEALLELLNLQPNAREMYRPNFERVLAKMTWRHVSQPLLDFCRNPKQAPDNIAKDLFQPSGWKQRLNQAWRALWNEGPRGVMNMINSYLRWKLKKE